MHFLKLFTKLEKLANDSELLREKAFCVDLKLFFERISVKFYQKIILFLMKSFRYINRTFTGYVNHC